MVASLDIGASKVACFIMKADGVRRCDKTVRVAGVDFTRPFSIIRLRERTPSPLANRFLAMVRDESRG